MTVGARDEFHRGNAHNAGCSWTLDARMRRATTSEGFSTVAARSARARQVLRRLSASISTTNGTATATCPRAAARAWCF